METTHHEHPPAFPVTVRLADVDPKPLACSIVRQPDHAAPTLNWDAKPVTMAVHRLLDQRTSATDNSHAEKWLHDALAHSPTRADDIYELAQAEGYGRKQMRRAFHAIGGIRRRRGAGDGAFWIWALPGDEKRLAEFRLQPIEERRLQDEERRMGIGPSTT